MQTRRLLALALVSLALVSLALLTACGSGSSGTHSQPSTPVFTSSPVVAATQDVVYTYQVAATDPAGGSVTFSLTTSPTGAALSGNTITWTPTAAQSRVSNPFEVTATTTSGGTATQKWTVTPGGTITVNWVNTYWTATGQVQVPELPSESLSISALVTNPDGSITVEKSSATSPGVFSIPNVPAGYYWLQIGNSGYWTSTATFDAGRDIAGGQVSATGTQQITQFAFSLSGLATVPEATTVVFGFPVTPSPLFGFTDFPNTPTLTAQGGVSGDTDWSKIDTAFLSQHLPVSLGSLNNVVLGPSWTATGLSLVSGGTNAITETLQPSPPASLTLTVPGSQWAPLFTNAAPSAPTPFSSALLISAEAYVTGRNALGSSSLLFGPSPTTLAATAGFGFFSIGSCDATGFPVNSFSAQSAILTDQNFGTLTYGDPFPSAWTRSLSFCQESMVAIPTSSSTTVNFALVDGVTVAPSDNASLAPVVSPVQNPTVNGASLFTAATLNTTVVPLAWSAPTSGAPYGYKVLAFVQATNNGIQTYLAAGNFSTAKTSITLPPLSGGNTYVLVITALADGTAQMETGPFRSSLPTGFANVVSAPITISSSALAPAIHGDRRVITRLSQAQARVAAH